MSVVEVEVGSFFLVLTRLSSLQSAMSATGLGRVAMVIVLEKQILGKMVIGHFFETNWTKYLL